MVLALLLPVRCPICDAAGPAPCAPCVGRLRPAVPAALPPGLDVCGSLLAYEGEARTLVTRLKYRNDRAALAWLADGMAALLDPPPGVVVTWAPTSIRRRRQRGFDQAQLLATAVARRWAVPCRRLLERDHGPPQTGLPLAERRRGPSFRPTAASFTITTPPTLGCVIVVDDVTTTGSTLTAASWALRSAGASWVGAVTAARTPRLTAILPRDPPVLVAPPSSPALAPAPSPAPPRSPVSLSVPSAPPAVESPLQFGGRSADVSR
jgi:predicted amidophosphoribosyltransferase